ncbi:MAG: hypothetical protein EOP49_06210, partial [Sphingobacteriales bacterium]
MLRSLLLFLILFATPPLGAQQNDVYTSFGTNDGLPQSSVWSIVQDGRGFIWFTTSDGLCRFDGYNFTTYRGANNDSNVIVGGAYIRIYLDSSGNLWTASQRGIGYYDKLRDEFLAVFRNRQDNTYDYNSIIGEDNRFIFAGISDFGMVAIDKRTLKSKELTGGMLPAVRNWRMTATCNNEIWIAGANKGSYVYDRTTGVIDTLPLLTLTNIINYNDSILLSVTVHEIVLFKKADHSYRTIRINLDKNERNITSVLPLSPDEILAAGSEGLYYISTKTWKLLRHVQSFTTGQLHTYAFIQSSFKDRSGNLWLGTNGDGLKKLTAPFKRFKHYSSFKPNGNLVKAIYATGQYIYVGYYDNGLDVFDRVSGLKASYTLNNGPLATTVLAITGLSDSEQIFQGNPPHSMGMLQNGRILNITSLFRNELQLKDVSNINPFLLSAGNTIYTNIANHLLVSFQLCDGKPCRIAIVHDFGSEILNCMYRERDGTIWV